MDHERVKATLRLIGKVYRRILDDDTKAYVLPAAVEGVQKTKEDYDHAVRNQNRDSRYKPEPWGYTIDHDQPLRFISTKINRIDFQVDVYCDVRWANEDVPVKQDIKVRIWSQHDATIFKPERDSLQIEEALLDPRRIHAGRVVSRFHFDRGNRDHEGDPQEGPEYHLQVGGKPEEYELCWHPESVKVPRLAWHPMELFLTCQLIAKNFFPAQYMDIQQKREWREELKLYQDSILLHYYEKCLNHIKNHESLLDKLDLKENLLKT